MVTRYKGKLISKVITLVLKLYSIGPLNLGIFIANNTGTNNLTIKEVLRVLRPKVTVPKVRGRCIAYIINLVAKAYLFSKDVEAFSIIVDALDESNPDEDTIRVA